MQFKRLGKFPKDFHSFFTHKIGIKIFALTTRCCDKQKRFKWKIKKKNLPVYANVELYTKVTK